MDWLSTVLKILEAGLGILDSKLATQYLDQALSIKKVLFEEMNKPVYIPGMKDGTYRSDAIIDFNERKLRILCDSFAREAGAARSKVLPPSM